jgi:hypothetical protein
MRDHYHGFSHPVLDLATETLINLFVEMDRIADEIRANPTHVNDDDQFAFRQLQKMLLPDLSREQFLYMYCLWCEHYAGRQFIDDDERAARLDELSDERDALFSAREQFPEHRAELTARLYEIGRELAELMPKFPAAPLGDWV